MTCISSNKKWCLGRTHTCTDIAAVILQGAVTWIGCCHGLLPTTILFRHYRSRRCRSYISSTTATHWCCISCTSSGYFSLCCWEGNYSSTWIFTAGTQFIWLESYITSTCTSWWFYSCRARRETLLPTYFTVFYWMIIGPTSTEYLMFLRYCFEANWTNLKTRNVILISGTKIRILINNFINLPTTLLALINKLHKPFKYHNFKKLVYI